MNMSKFNEQKMFINKTWVFFLFTLMLVSGLQMPVQAAKLNKKQVILFEGQSTKLKLQKAKGTVKWSSSNKKVCKVKKGKVTAVKAGDAKIKATVKKKGKKKKSYTCKVKVVANDISTDKNIGNPCGTSRKSSKGRWAAVYASAFVGKGYYEMPSEIQIQSFWCAAFAKYMYSDTNRLHNHVTNIVKDAVKDNRFHVTNDEVKNYGPVDASYEPQIGDCVIYEEDERFDEFEHIGIVADKRWCGEHNRWEIVSIEGNYFEVSADISKYEYCNKSLNNSFDSRKVGRIDFEDIRYGMVAGYVSPAFNQEHDIVVGDINGDRKVNFADLIIMKDIMFDLFCDEEPYYYTKTYGHMSPQEVYYRCDINGNGTVNLLDWTYLKRYLVGNYTPPER